MQVQISHPVFDIEARIVEAGDCPSPVNLYSWQERIDAIVGKTVEGRSRLRIVWGQDFGSASMICVEKRIHKYPFWFRPDGTTIGKPRYFVEELHDLGELKRNDAWERARHRRNAVGEIVEDVLGPIPEEGFYTPVFMIAHHDALCCNGRELVNGEICLGSYRPPTDSDLQRIRRMKYNRDHATNDERIPSDERLQQKYENATEARNQRWRENTRAVIDDFMKSHAWQFSEFDPTAISWGKYHFTAGHSKSGLQSKDKLDVSSDTGPTA